MKRIAPIEMPNHPEVIEYLNELSMQWELRRMGEPHMLTLELIGHWRTVRKSLNDCREIDDRLSIGYQPKWDNRHTGSVQIIDRIILKLESEYGWPAPKEPLVNELDIQQLRMSIREIEDCRSEPRVWY